LTENGECIPFVLISKQAQVCTIIVRILGRKFEFQKKPL